jgi:hypothetical protein
LISTPFAVRMASIYIRPVRTPPKPRVETTPSTGREPPPTCHAEPAFGGRPWFPPPGTAGGAARAPGDRDAVNTAARTHLLQPHARTNACADPNATRQATQTHMPRLLTRFSTHRRGMHSRRPRTRGPSPRSSQLCGVAVPPPQPPTVCVTCAMGGGAHQHQLLSDGGRSAHVRQGLGREALRLGPALLPALSTGHQKRSRGAFLRVVS